MEEKWPALFAGAGASARVLQSETVPAHSTSIRVRYAETDQMGIVYYANYLVWMEVARVDYCRSIGFHYKTVFVRYSHMT